MLDKLYQALLGWAGDNAWIAEVFVVVFLTLVLSLLVGLFSARLHRRLQETRVTWDDAFISALRKPLGLLIWIVGIAFAADIVRLKTEATIFNAVAPLRDVGVIAVITWFLLRLVSNLQQDALDRGESGESKVDATTVDAIGKLVKASIIITAILVALQTLGFSISGVLAFGGIGGIAIGFAAKDLLSNFFGGLMLYLDRPFIVGDWIRSPDRDIEGTVETIGWRLTCIRTFDKRPIYVPNGIFSNIAVINPSRMSHRRIHETIGLRYDDINKVSPVIDDIRSMLMNHPEIDTSQTLMVNFNSFSESSLDFFVYTFTRTTVWTRYHEIKQDVLLKISDIVAAHGAEIAYPTSTLHMPELAQIAANATHPG